MILKTFNSCLKQLVNLAIDFFLILVTAKLFLKGKSHDQRKSCFLL